MLSFVLSLVRLGRAVARCSRDPEFRALFLVFLLMLGSGTIFFVSTEGWSILDALYFCMASLSTVGYGDLTPKTSMGKVFMIVYLPLGIGVFVALATKLAASVIKPAPEDSSKAEQALRPADSGTSTAPR